MANVSGNSSPTNSSISVLVILNPPAHGAQYYTTISCYKGSTYIGTSPNLGGLPAYNSSATHWTKPYTFYGLDSGTTYTFTASSTWGSITSTSISTTGSPPSFPPYGSPHVTHYSSRGTTINLQVQNAYGATEILFTHWNGTDTRWVRSTPYIETFYAPEYGTEYQISKKGRNSDGDSSWTNVWATTEPYIPSISSGGSGGVNKLIIDINPTGGWTTIDVEMWTIDGISKLETQTKSWNGGYSFSLTFGYNSPLTPNASYLFKARANKTSSNSSYHPTSGWGGWLTLKNAMARPNNWYWTTAQNVNGHKISGTGYSMLASEWNSFTARINLFRAYKGLSTIGFSSATRGNRFYYYMFNEAIVYINHMNNTGVGNVTTGSKMYASNFNSLMNALNNIS